MHWWCRQYPVTDAAQEAKVTETTAVQAYQYFRDICSWRLINRDSPLLLGGPGVVVQVVQIDESLFLHKPKVKQHYVAEKCQNKAIITRTCLILQNHRGRPPRTEQWVFGMVDTSHTPAIGYMEMVPCRDANTLLPIIQQHVHPGTIIHSDEWAAYNRVQHLPPVAHHGTVNHSITFVDPATGVHTQNVESYWNRVKTKFKRMKGVHEQMLSSYLDEFMWRERHGQTASAALRSLCRDIALRYPV